MHALECCVKWQARRRPAVQVHRGAQQLRQQNRFIFSILFFSSIFLMIQRLFKKKFISRYLPTCFGKSTNSQKRFDHLSSQFFSGFALEGAPRAPYDEELSFLLPGCDGCSRCVPSGRSVCGGSCSRGDMGTRLQPRLDCDPTIWYETWLPSRSPLFFFFFFSLLGF